MRAYGRMAPMTLDQSAKEYLRSVEEYADPLWVEEVNYFCENFLDTSDGAVIDIGCGLGCVLNELPRKNRFLVGLDINRFLVRHAKEHLSNSRYDFVLADAHNLPFKSNSFDYSFMIEVVEHLADPMRAMNECARILRPSGKLTVTTPNGFYYRTFHHRSTVSPFHINEYTFWEIKRMLIHAGFSVNRWRTSNRSWLRSILRILGKMPILVPFVPGRFYIDAIK